MRTRDSIDIEHNGRTIRFSGELMGNGFVAFADHYKWKNMDGSPDTREARLEMMEAAIEYCSQHDGWGKLSFVTGDFVTGDNVIKFTTLWERLGLCPHCGGKYIGRYKKRCESGICDGEHFYMGSKLYKNIWRAFAVVGLLFCFGLPLYLLGIFPAIAFTAGYSIVVLICGKIFNVVEKKDQDRNTGCKE